MVNGYVTLDLASNKIYKEALGAIKSGKPVMVVDAPNVYFADTIAIDTDNDDNVVITKGGKTITITDANSVSSEGDIQNHLYILTFNSGDYRISTIATKKLEDKEIDVTQMTNDDKEYIKSLKDIMISEIGFMYGSDSPESTTPTICAGIYSNVLYLTIDGYEYEINLINPTDESTGDKLTITFKQLF